MTTATVRCVTEDTEPPLSQADRNSLTIVANRLPVHRNADNKWELSPGGLVSALVPVLQKRQGRWIGWGGSCIVSDRTTNLKVDGIILDEVAISKLDFEQYYTKISNGVLWPLFHDRLRQPEFSQDAWRGYRRVNALFVELPAWWPCVDPGLSSSSRPGHAESATPGSLYWSLSAHPCPAGGTLPDSSLAGRDIGIIGLGRLYRDTNR